MGEKTSHFGYAMISVVKLAEFWGAWWKMVWIYARISLI